MNKGSKTTPSRLGAAIYPAIGLGVWLNGAVLFRMGGRALFASGPAVAVLTGLGVAAAVCGVFRTTLSWRRADPRNAVAIAALMATPGLFAESLRMLLLHPATGLDPNQAATFASVIFFGNGALFAYALAIQLSRAKAPL
ncbi:DUF5367 family protein [Phenylobacterium montanum]|uniref:Transmembrane protein n=1 Tax=Phenylobacterium montanum TaxID=2823693 RepID=A0A975G333_9CAUL|nr:DUF5367 family protein [Caulobacter sp. S6]QUD89796.1 hypothetical protein KCG34_07980 [Caulobacter sp. S6]